MPASTKKLIGASVMQNLGIANRQPTSNPGGFDNPLCSHISVPWVWSLWLLESQGMQCAFEADKFSYGSQICKLKRPCPGVVWTCTHILYDRKSFYTIIFHTFQLSHFNFFWNMIVLLKTTERSFNWEKGKNYLQITTPSSFSIFPQWLTKYGFKCHNKISKPR